MNRNKLIDLISESLIAKGQDGLHIVIEDGNIENSHIIWCRDEWEHTTMKGKLIANELLKLGLKQRGIVLGEAWNKTHRKEN